METRYLNPYPLPRYGIAQSVRTDEIENPNKPKSYYAYVQKSTGLATAPNLQNPDDETIQTYGPYIFLAATATVYDISLILHRKHHFVGNFRPLARCVLAVIQRRLAANGSPADPPLLVVYGSYLVDALVIYIYWTVNPTVLLRNIIMDTFHHAVQLLQKDFAEYGQNHLQLLNDLLEDVIQAYRKNSWPDDVWPEFLLWVYKSIVPSAVLPKCFQVLIGAKAIEEQEKVVLPDKKVVPFRTNYAGYLCAVVEDQLAKRRVQPIITAQISFIKMIVYVLGRHFDSERDLDIKPSHRPSLFARYAGHIADALIICFLDNRNNGGFQILGKTYPRVLDISPDEYFDGIKDSCREFAMLAAFDEIVASYNNRQWPEYVWSNLLAEINNSHRNPEMGSLVSMYDVSCGGTRHRCTDLWQLVPDIEPWTNEDEAFETSGGEQIEDYEEEEKLDDCYNKPEECLNCLGPSSVSYTFRWLCKSDHTLEGLREETFGPFGVMSGDCASRIHDEVKKIFPFATAFPTVRRHPKCRAPNFVVGSCLHF